MLGQLPRVLRNPHSLASTSIREILSTGDNSQYHSLTLVFGGRGRTSEDGKSSTVTWLKKGPDIPNRVSGAQPAFLNLN